MQGNNMYLRILVSAALFLPVVANGQTWVPLGPAKSPQSTGAQAAVLPVQAEPAVAVPQTTTEAKPHLGKIIMYRGSSVFGAGVGCPIRYKGQEVVELGRGKFAEWSVEPGRYILNNHTSSIEVAVDPGETRYVRCMIKMGALTGRADLQIVDEESFNEHRNEYEQKPMDVVVSSSTSAGQR
jgi:hypothetical protein